MATYELYLGGPATAGVGRRMYPSASFNADGTAFQSMRVSAHKGPKLYALNRVFDFANEDALLDFVAAQDEAGSPLATGDVLGAIMIPQDTILLGVAYKVVTPSGDDTLTVTPGFRGDATNTLPAITASGSASKGFAAPTATAWTTTMTQVATGLTYIPDPVMLDLTLTALPASGFGALRLEVTALVADLHAGQY